MNTVLKAVSKKVWGVGVFLIVVVSIAFYFVLGLGAKTSIVDHTLDQQQTVARAEAANIESFFSDYGNALKTLSDTSSIVTPGVNTTDDMQAFVDHWSKTGVIAGVLLTDANGIVKFNANVERNPDLGANLSDRDYFVWAKDSKNDNNYFVGKAIIGRVGPSLGQVIVPVAAGVYKEGKFVGVLTSGVYVSPMTKLFLNLMKVEDQTNVYVVGQTGNILYNSLVPDSAGSNSFELLQSEPFLGSQDVLTKLKDALASGKEGTLTIPLANRTGKTESFLVAYSPVDLVSRRWLLVVASPYTGVSSLTTPVYIHQLAVFILVALSILLFGVIVILDTRKLPEDAVEEPQSKL